MRAIVADDLRHSFGELVALNGVSFEIEAGEVVALLGPNGAGKTTTLEILEGYLAPMGGRVQVLGTEPSRGGRSWRSRVGVMLQTTSLESMLTAREALATFAGLYFEPRPVDEVLSLIGLQRDAHTRIGQLSGGQQRRVELGLAIIGRPQLLFLDEPTTGLDPAARRDAWAIVEELADRGTTVLLSTHNLEEAQQLADRLLVLQGGRLVADGTPDDLRAAQARSVVRLPHPSDAVLPPLPDRLAGHLAHGGLEIHADRTELGVVLEQLLAWARAAALDLGDLKVSPPSLEDTYLGLTTSDA